MSDPYKPLHHKGERDLSLEPALPPDRPDALTGVILASDLDPFADSNHSRQQDRDQAILDLCETARFRPSNLTGPFILHLSVAGNQGLVFDVRSEENVPLYTYAISVKPFSRLIKDYDLMIDSFDEAVQEGNRTRIQAIDMGRRGLHDEAGELLMSRLEGKIAMDRPTARRLFTLICLLVRRN
ncbi:UPF0262 family protein [Acetobacter sp. AN02]|uniref:UPF0262 family protein n=1 Tax=Acetobacter sp. AN02 TaxID=2894186 RepID=UPI002434442F|nr:UPF0262 family protein [Acetobacter sp. AN02]MDG6094702.1 UPF0262 family protein [Acetobacter sp. AN02]